MITSRHLLFLLMADLTLHKVGSSYWVADMPLLIKRRVEKISSGQPPRTRQRLGGWMILPQTTNQQAKEWVETTGLSKHKFARRKDALDALDACLLLHDEPLHETHPPALKLGKGHYLLTGGLIAKRKKQDGRWQLSHPAFPLFLEADSIWRCRQLAATMHRGDSGFSSISLHLQAATRQGRA